MYGTTIWYTTKAEGQISWEGDDTVMVRKNEFSIIARQRVQASSYEVVLYMDGDSETIPCRADELLCDFRHCHGTKRVRVVG
jgi:hypothetical protein